MACLLFRDGAQMLWAGLGGHHCLECRWRRPSCHVTHPCQGHPASLVQAALSAQARPLHATCAVYVSLLGSCQSAPQSARSSSECHPPCPQLAAGRLCLRGEAPVQTRLFVFGPFPGLAWWESCVLWVQVLCHVCGPHSTSRFLRSRCFQCGEVLCGSRSWGSAPGSPPVKTPETVSRVLAVWGWLFACVRAAVSLCVEVLLSQHHLLESHALSMEWTLPLGQQSAVWGSVLGSVLGAIDLCVPW